MYRTKHTANIPGRFNYMLMFVGVGLRSKTTIRKKKNIYIFFIINTAKPKSFTAVCVVCMNDYFSCAIILFIHDFTV